MNRIRHIRRIAGVLAGLAAALLAFGAAPAFAAPTLATMLPGGADAPVPSAPPSVQVHTIITGGMAGWQITLIAVGAALLAATVAVLVDRARAAHRHAITTAA
jgi:hypothetical protein